MTYPSKTLDDYQRLGELTGLMLVSLPPKSVLLPAEWQCTLCGRTHLRSYSKLKYAERGCRCQGEVGKSADDYRSLAQRLGLKWIGRQIPQTVQHTTPWAAFNGDLFEASYHELGYALTHIPSRLYDYLSPTVRDKIEDAKEERRERIQSRTANL